MKIALPLALSTLIACAPLAPTESAGPAPASAQESARAQESAPAQESARAASGKLADFMNSRPTHRVLHGWGQDIYRWDGEAIPYFKAISTRPVIVSTYLKIADPTRQARTPRMGQFDTIPAGWRDSNTGKRYPFVPLIGVQTHPANFGSRGNDLSREFLVELGLGDKIRGRSSANLTYDFRVFQKLAERPQVWRQVYDHLQKRGYDVEGLESLDGILTNLDSRSPRLDKLAKLWDDVMLKANENLKRTKGYRFGDLEIIAGTFDEDIRQLGRKIAGVDGPVLVRLMYETIGGIHRGTIYGPDTFKQAWRHFADLLRASGADNAELVFHSAMGVPSILDRWYPGDDYVDWMAGSLFGNASNPREWRSEARFGAERGKPYIIAESGPTSKEFSPRGVDSPRVWERWFEPYFRFLKSEDAVKAFVYININWAAGPNSSFADWGNIRVQSNPQLLSRYQQELREPVYMHNEEFWQAFDAWRGRSR